MGVLHELERVIRSLQAGARRAAEQAVGGLHGPKLARWEVTANA